jgi:hypothetical protein
MTASSRVAYRGGSVDIVPAFPSCIHGGIQAFLKSLWARVRPQAQAAAVYLDAEPSRATSIEVLAQFGPSTRENVYVEVNSTDQQTHRTLTRHLGRLESLELVESRLGRGRPFRDSLLSVELGLC